MKNIKYYNKPVIIKTDKYKTIDLVLIFPYHFDKNHLFGQKLIKQLVSNYSLEYRNEQDFKKELLDSLIISYRTRYFYYYNSMFYEFDLTIPNPKYVKDFDMNRALKLFFETIYKPCAENNEFNLKYFTREKQFIIENLKLSLNDIDEYSILRYLHHLDKKSSINYSMINHMDKIEEETPKTLYDFYKKIIINNKPMIFAYGDIEEDNFNTLLKQYLNYDNKEYSFKGTYYHYLKPQKLKVVTEKSHFKDSILYLGYKIKNFKYKDIFYSSVLVNILDRSETNLLLNKLRYKDDLVYGSDAYLDSSYCFITINLYIKPESKDKAIKDVKEVINSLHDEKILKKNINNILKNMEVFKIREKDNKYNELDNIIKKTIKHRETLEQLYNMYKILNTKEFINFLDRLVLDTIYYLEGEDNGK